MVLPDREYRYANFSFENTYHMPMFSVLDAECCRYIVSGWPGEPQHHNPANVLADHLTARTKPRSTSTR